MPEYLKAQQEIDAAAERYKSDIESRMDILDDMYKSYQSQKDRLSSSMRTQKENEIINYEREVQKRQQTFFGEDGVMAKKSETLLTPIKEKVQKAVEYVAERHNCTMIVDISVAAGVVYTNPKYNYTDDVKEYLNIK